MVVGENNLLGANRLEYFIEWAEITSSGWKVQLKPEGRNDKPEAWQ